MFTVIIIPYFAIVIIIIVNFITISPFSQDETLELSLVPLSLRHSVHEDNFQNICVICPFGAFVSPCLSSVDSWTTAPGPHCESPCSSPALLCPGLHPHAIVTSYKCQSDLSKPSRHIWNTIWGLGRGGWGSWPRHLCPRHPDHLSSLQALSPVGWPLLGLGSLHLPSLRQHVLPWTITRPARVQCSGLGSGGTYLGRPFLTHCVKHAPHPSLYHFVCLVVAGFSATY